MLQLMLQTEAFVQSMPPLHDEVPQLTSHLPVPQVMLLWHDEVPQLTSQSVAPEQSTPPEQSAVPQSTRHASPFGQTTFE